MTLSPSLEDYLESIWIIGTEKKVVRVKDIEKYLNVRTSSVIGALKSLADKDLVIPEKYRYVELTETGIKKSKEIYKRHKILTEFFTKVLNIEKKSAMKDACKIEHHINPETVKRLNFFMEFIKNYSDTKPEWLEEFHNELKNKNH